MTWAGSVGVLAAGVMVAVAMEDHALTGYVVGGLVTGLALIGYIATRRGAFVVVAILGLLVAYASGFDDVVGDRSEDDRFVSIVAVAIVAFAVAITVLGWMLPSRVLSGVVAGVIATGGLTLALGVLVVGQFIFGAFGAAMTGLDGEGTPPEPPSHDTDVWVILALVAGLVLLWTLAAAITDHPGFTVLAIVLPAIAVPLAVVALAEEHPTWWGAGLAVPGCLVLALAALLARRKGRLARSRRN